MWIMVYGSVDWLMFSKTSMHMDRLAIDDQVLFGRRGVKMATTKNTPLGGSRNSGFNTWGSSCRGCRRGELNSRMIRSTGARGARASGSNAPWFCLPWAGWRRHFRVHSKF
jgi:hypothetical protein